MGTDRWADTEMCFVYSEELYLLCLALKEEEIESYAMPQIYLENFIQKEISTVSMKISDDLT